MSLPRDQLELLACPICRSSLRETDGTLGCSSCGSSYSIENGVPDLLPWSKAVPGQGWARWRRKLDRLQEWRRSTWDGSRQAEGRQRLADDLAREFFRFARLPGIGPVLEIGCGSADLRREIPDRPYWGLDPVPIWSDAVRDERTVLLRGIGEMLPFADESFEAALLCETLDHTMDPERVILEVFRILEPGGVLAIMQSVSVRRPDVPLARRLRVALGRLKARFKRHRVVHDDETKTHMFDRDGLTALVGGSLRVDARAIHDAVLFLRAVRP